ncbi:Uncharacterized membrane protein, DUF373 family [Filomicrobium insigne]|uniref:Uncharacterized membrane protein, DUF373 family n=1 Tax=Filomicrobium insigne TaxID=418854 RepID=A0A1H0GJR7_9HYPH|nr:phosphate-starvation-inducible PsiE family protein [Filomicrobium insigne]SDO06999.1 Uncharacterized membrane protein, DUF373 family [Filomicrobium insigne]
MADTANKARRQMAVRIFSETRKHWAQQNWYQRFEEIIVVVLSIIVAIVILVAVLNLVLTLYNMLRFNILDASHPAAFQAVFGMIMIVIIALEFNHTILGQLERGLGVVHVRAVVLIALLAVLRKFIVTEIGEADADLLFALSASTIALGAVYWAIRQQDHTMRSRQPEGE